MSPVKNIFWRVADSLLNLRHMVLVSSAIFFIVIGIAFFLVYQNAKVMHDQINADFNQQQLILAWQAASQIDALLQDIVLDLEHLRRLRAQKAEDYPFGEAARASLDRNRMKGLIEIGITDPDGRVVEIYDGAIGEIFDARRIEADCRTDASGRLELGPLRVEPAPGGHNIVTGMICAPAAQDNGSPGVLFAKIDVSGLVSQVTRDIRSGKTGYAWVIDEDGTFLYHPEKEFIGKNAFTARKERKPYISFKQINAIMKERMLRGEDGTGIYVSGWHRGIEGELTKLIAFTPVKSRAIGPGHAWSVAVAAPISEVAETVHRVYVRHFMAEAALILGMFVFGLLVALYQQRISQALKEKVKRTEADLHETERIYQRIVEQATDLIYILDLEMRVVLLNQLAIETFSNLVVTSAIEDKISDDADLSRPELYIGRRLDELFSEPDVAFMRSRVDRVLENKKSLSYEHYLNIKGKKITLSTKLIPIRDDKGEVHYLLGISRDVTEKMEVDQRIYNTEKLASIGTLAAGVAHEINNPLAVILGFTDLLMERFQEGSPELEDLKVIDYNANHAKKVVENLLGFARITEGLEDTVDIPHSLQTVMNIVKNTLMTKKIDIRMEVPESLPCVQGDAREFQQVIFNLINNSVAAMGEQGGVLTISAHDEDGWVHVSVTDTGMGIPDKIKPRIFDPFFTTKKVGEGTGLGLSLCYGIVKKYGGRMSFVSTAAEDHPDRPTGTAFTVSMPAPKDQRPGKGGEG
ncbi:MAG TPA: ATP-binding protein [bacterium]|nr:ATP-binding protein [bacterium]